jgi:AAA15 family ATPase/GTPase
MREIPDIIILAGPNGSGKSSVLEAIAYAKEAVASYSQNNPMINRINNTQLISSNADSAKIEVDFLLNDNEKRILKSMNLHYNDIESLVVTIENTVSGRRKNHNVNPLGSNISDGFRYVLSTHGETPNLGLMDYIDAHRIFHRQEVSTFNFSINSENDRQKRFSSAAEKFNQLKNTLLRLHTMDSFQLREDFKKGELSEDKEKYLVMDRKIEKAFELLASKKYEGIDINSNPFKFEVSTPLGEIDIDELSSGEKEIIFILLELLALNLNNSIILFDEPDLHLNEGVQHKFIEFIKSLGKHNQIWMTTHSASIINTAESDSLFRVELHNPQRNNNQVVKILDNNSRIELLYNVLGTKSILTLGEKIVFLEGVVDNDKFIFDTWFDNLKNSIVFVSSGSVNNINKITEKNLSLLEESTKFNYFYCIRDGDFAIKGQKQNELSPKQRLFQLERYHIENYLLDEELIYDIVRVYHKNNLNSHDDVRNALKSSINKHKNNFILKILENRINNMIFLDRFSVRGDFNKMDRMEILQQITQYEQTLKSLSQTPLRSDKLMMECETYFDNILNSSNDRWKYELPGRDILKFFIQDHLHNLIHYELFRDSLVDKIKVKGIPEDIQTIIEKIANE